MGHGQAQRPKLQLALASRVDEGLRVTTVCAGIPADRPHSLVDKGEHSRVMVLGVADILVHCP